MKNKKGLAKLRHNKIYQRELTKLLNAFALRHENKITFQEHLDCCHEFERNINSLIEDKEVERIP
jgi:hypothetical protein